MVIVAVSMVSFLALTALLLHQVQVADDPEMREKSQRFAVLVAILSAWLWIEAVVGWRRRPRTQQPTGPFGPISHLHWKELRRIFAIGAAFLLFGLAWTFTRTTDAIRRFFPGKLKASA